MKYSDFINVRSSALERYNALERTVSQLFSGLAETPQHFGEMIFFSITNYQTRITIIEKLLKERDPDLVVFFKSLKKLLGEATDVRNKVVHWTAVGEVSNNQSVIDLTAPDAVYLVDPSTSSTDAQSSRLSFNDLQRFIVKARFLQDAVSGLQRVKYPLREWSYTFWDNEDEIWRDRFKTAIIYPPPEGGSMFENYAIYVTQHPTIE